jgi:hypothetical protein
MDGAAVERDEVYRKFSPELEVLLWALWNPIGDVPVNEYGRYAPQIWRLLDEQAGVDTVGAELARICEESMELQPGDHAATAARLIDWWHWRFLHPAEPASDAS